MNAKRKICFECAKRIVVKVGSGVLTEDNGLNLKALRSISRQICQLADRGLEIILVSSGAIASGIKKIGLSKRPDEVPKRQAIAAIGQAGLIMEYEKAFDRYNKKAAQILLTSDDLVNRKRYLNARNTLCTLLSWQVIPIINENDTVVVEEIKYEDKATTTRRMAQPPQRGIGKFGDNDNLSAMITLLMDADILINLTDIDGLYNKDPRKHPDAELIPLITTVNKEIEKYASDIPGALGTGGMLTKILAAKKVTSAGIPMLIGKGEKPNILLKIFSGKELGTFFIPKKEKLANRKCWIAFTLKPKGIIRIDDGAADAILNRGKSLLPSGIVDVEGEFRVGAAVEFRRENNDEILGTGLVNYSSSDIRKIMGLKSGKIKQYLGYKPYDEVIHRDNLAITCECNA